VDLVENGINKQLKKMNNPKPFNWQFSHSVLKLALRLGVAICLIDENLIAAGTLLIVSELLIILKEI